MATGAEAVDLGATAGVTWRQVDPKFDAGPATRATLGLLVLATDMATENDLATLLQVDGVAHYVSRMPMAEHADADSLADLGNHLTEATERLVPWTTFDAIAFGCTSGSIAVGPAQAAARIQAVKPGVPVLNPVDAAIAGLRTLGCRRVAVLTPYIDEVNAMLARYLVDQGLALGDCASFKQSGDPQMNRIDPRHILEVAAEHGASDCDGLFISCTGLRTSGIVQAIEERIGKPVVTSNQALAWATLRAAGIEDRLDGFGRLLQN